MEIVNDRLAVQAHLTTPTDSGFLLLAAEVGGWAGPFALPSRARRRVLDQAGGLCAHLLRRADVAEATVFRAALRPPGEGTPLLRRRGIRPARFDVVVLVRAESVPAAEALRAEPVWRKLAGLFDGAARHTRVTAASNAARIADVDHNADSWFLFNYFHGDDRETVFDVWQYTAGWFQRETSLSDSALMQPLPGEFDDYSLVNHASWPALRTFLPALLLRRSFRSFVLANFAANGVAAQPIIYRRTC
ncbi:hypothetical protein [Nocardia grenadensis]|uniref:hypothetical protein n=1 Tax=Nocardia grenadensis TaxID=931537 RepID=UPI0007A437BA|nr:hypothetical protein [Nocardia grenadensis]